MSGAAQNKVLEEPKLKKCGHCRNYVRKIEEVEQSLSGRDAIVTVLQTQLKKCEINYKRLINEFEQLRFQHSTTLQDNLSLKEINSKLEEFTVDKKKCTLCHQCPMTTSAVSHKQRPVTNTNPPLLQEVHNIEKLVKTQNQVLKELIEKVVKEVKFNKSENFLVLQEINNIEEDFKQIESGDHLDTHPKFQKLASEIETLKALVDEHQKENERMRKIIGDKRDRLTKCTTVSASIAASNNYRTSDKKDQGMSTFETADQNYQKVILQLQLEMQEKEKQFEKCSCQLMDQLNDMHSNNQNLTDTLAVITDENKNNLMIISKLKMELNRVNQDYEKRIDALNSRINELESILEENKLLEKKLKNSVDLTETEAKNLKNRLKHVVDENYKLKDCQCDTEIRYKTKLEELEVENAELRREVTEKTLEMSEYEEENRYFCQRMDVLTNYNIELANRIKNLEDELVEKSKVIENYGRNTQTSRVGFGEWQEGLAKLNKEKQCVGEKCKQQELTIADKSCQLDCLKTSVKIQLEELRKLGSENEELRKEIDVLKNENKRETEKLQAQVNYSQRQVETLLKEHDEKTSHIESVANELDNIRRSVTEDNQHFLRRIAQLEKEKVDLMKKLREFEKLKDCNCGNGKEEIERLKAELIKKQCIIAELEKSVDSFNETLKNFDKTAEDLASENANLKTDKERLIKQLELLQVTTTGRSKEFEETRKRLAESERVCKTCTEDNKKLEVENRQLKHQCDCSLSEQRAAELENDKLKVQLENLNMEKGRIERTLVDNYQLQMEVESLKENNSRRESVVSSKLQDLQKAYDELKSLFDKRNLENEKLRNDIKNCVRCKDEMKMNCECLQTENDKLKKRAKSLTVEVDALKRDRDTLKEQCNKKCLEMKCLKEIMDEKKMEQKLCEEDCQKLRQKHDQNAKELTELKRKWNELRESYEQKCDELKKIKKQWESCFKQSQISRNEYTNLRKEYKEIKSMLAEQIKKYRLDTGNVENNQTSQIVRELKQQVLEKENQMVALQKKLKDASYEIVELKDYIHKLICDNNILKSAINNLIGNLERKIKGPSFASLASGSAEVIAGEILHSLTTIEDTIIKNSEGCPRGCRGKNCDCMSEIASHYSFQESQPGPSRINLEYTKSDSDHPLKNVESFNLSCPRLVSITISEPSSKPTSQLVNKVSSENNSTDSDEPRSVTFLDKKSVEFFKDAIQDLKIRVDRSMKEKCCDCD